MNVKIGKKISQILNQCIANQTYLGILIDKEIEDSNYDNYWEKLQNVADLVAEQLNKNEERFYITFYYKVLKMTKKNINPDKIYTKKDYEIFKTKMYQIFNRACVPIDVMNIIGFTPDKIFLKAISEQDNFKNKTKQVISLLEIANNQMILGEYNNDLQDFILNIIDVYEKIENSNNQELFAHFTESLLGAYFTTLKKSTTIELRKAKDIYFIENPYIEELMENLKFTPKINSNPNSKKKIFNKYPQFYSDER